MAEIALSPLPAALPAAVAPPQALGGAAGEAEDFSEVDSDDDTFDGSSSDSHSSTGFRGCSSHLEEPSDEMVAQLQLEKQQQQIGGAAADDAHESSDSDGSEADDSGAPMCMCQQRCTLQLSTTDHYKVKQEVEPLLARSAERTMYEAHDANVAAGWFEYLTIDGGYTAPRNAHGCTLADLDLIDIFHSFCTR